MSWFVNSYGETLLGPDHSTRRTEHVPYEFVQAKNGFKQTRKMPSHREPVILGSLSLYFIKPEEPSDFLNQYFLIIILGLTFYCPRKMLFQICMTFTTCHKLVSQGVIGVTLFSILRFYNTFHIFACRDPKVCHSYF